MYIGQQGTEHIVPIAVPDEGPILWHNSGGANQAPVDTPSCLNVLYCMHILGPHLITLDRLCVAGTKTRLQVLPARELTDTGINAFTLQNPLEVVARRARHCLLCPVGSTPHKLDVLEGLK